MAALKILFVASLVFAFLYWEDYVPAIRLWQSNLHRVGYEDVVAHQKPHDCDFMAAPMGSKNCHFAMAVDTVMWRQNPPGTPQWSFDSGKTWADHTPGRCDFDAKLLCPNQFDPIDEIAPATPTATGVIVSWNKVSD